MAESLSRLACNRCGHQWWPRMVGRPKQCPKCRSPYWDKERTRHRKKTNDSHTTAACLSRWENGKRAIPKVAAAYFVNWVEPEIKKRITHV